MDIKTINKDFNKKQIILRDKYYSEAINGLTASGKYYDNADKLVELAFEIAIKAVNHKVNFNKYSLNVFRKIFN